MTLFMVSHCFIQAVWNTCLAYVVGVPWCTATGKVLCQSLSYARSIIQTRFSHTRTYVCLTYIEYLNECDMFTNVKRQLSQSGTCS